MGLLVKGSTMFTRFPALSAGHFLRARNAIQASQQTAVVRIQRSLAHPLTINPNGIQNDRLAHGLSTHQNRVNFLDQARPFLTGGPVQRLGMYRQPIFQTDNRPTPAPRFVPPRFFPPASSIADDNDSFRADTPDGARGTSFSDNDSVYNAGTDLADTTPLSLDKIQENKIKALTVELKGMRKLIRILEHKVKDKTPPSHDDANAELIATQDELANAKRRIANLEQQLAQSTGRPAPPPPPPPPLPNFGGNVSLREISQADIANQRRLLKKAGVIRGNEVQDAVLDARSQLIKDLKNKLTGKKEEIESGVTSNTVNLITLLERANRSDTDPKPYFKAVVNSSSVSVNPYNFSEVNLGLILNPLNTTGEAEFDEVDSIAPPVRKINLTLPAKRMAVEVKKVNGEEVRSYPYAEACAKAYLERLTRLQALVDPSVPVPIHIPIVADKLPSSEEVKVFTDILTNGIEDAGLTMPVSLYICTDTRTIKGYFLKELYNRYIHDIEQPS